jgi:hypothetical protein
LRERVKWTKKQLTKEKEESVRLSGEIVDRNQSRPTWEKIRLHQQIGEMEIL